MGLARYLIARKPLVKFTNGQNKVKENSHSTNRNNSQEIIIPDVCPHCKSPNSKKIRLCEWCGNQIV